MSTESIFSLLLSIPTGIISGLYAGIIVARYQRFADLRLHAKKLILEIDFVWEDAKMFFPRRKEVPEFFTIASDLFFLGHKSAGKKVLEVSQEIQQSIMEARAGKINSELFNERYGNWQQEIRALSPEMLKILRVRGGL